MEEVKKEPLDPQNEPEDGADTPDEKDGVGLTVEEQLAIEKKKNEKLYARAKKAEGFVLQSDGTWVKPQKPAVEPKPEAIDNTNANAQLTEELKLIAKGLSDEEIEQAKIISRGKGISLIEALKDPMFILYQKDLKEQDRKEKAKLGASKGSGNSEDDLPVKSGMTRDEHKAQWDKVRA